MYIIRFVLVIFGLALFGSIYGQSPLYKTDSLKNFNRGFGYGAANLIEIASKNSSYRPQVYLDFTSKNSKGFYYRAGISLSYKRANQAGLIINEFVPTNITVGAEKHYYKKDFFFILGGDLFYSMSIRKSRLGPFQFDDYGVGVAPYIGAGYALRFDLSLFAQYEAGVGYFREFVGVGLVTQTTLALRFAAIRNLSFGIRHFF